MTTAQNWSVGTEVNSYGEQMPAIDVGGAPMRSWLLIFVAVATMLGCSPMPPAAPVLVTDRVVFRESIRTIAFLDITFPAELSTPPNQDRLNVLVLDALQRAGFEVVRLDPAEWTKAADQVGGLFDPRTGEANPAKYDEAHALLVEAADAVAMKAIDGTAHPRLLIEAAGFANYNAMWSGTNQPPLTSGAAWSHFLGSTIVRGKIRALSIHLPIRDRTGAMVFQSLVGLELLDLYNASGKFQQRPLEDLFTDPKRLDTTANLLWETLTGETVVKQREGRPGIDDPMR